MEETELLEDCPLYGFLVTLTLPNPCVDTNVMALVNITILY